MLNLDFLGSNRFWALLFTVASGIFLMPDFPTQPWYINLGRFLAALGAGFITIRTVDRHGEVKPTPESK